MFPFDSLQYATAPLRPIGMEAISIQRGPYCMSFGYDETRLARSIEKVGLLNPPSLSENTTGGFDVVSGYRRVEAARFLGWEEIFCRDLTDLKMTTLDLLLLNLYDNLSTRSFNEIEKAMVLKRLSALVSQAKVIKDYMPLLGLSSYEPILRTYMLFEELEEPVKGGLAQGTLSAQAARLLLDFDVPSRLSIYECIFNLKLNYNHQKQLIEYLLELSDIENRSIHEILSGEPLAGILGKEHPNSPQKARSLLGVLRAMRNPRVADAERRFQHQLSLIHLPPGVRINHPPFFEETSFTLEISFEDGRTLKEKIVQISNTEGIENIQAPWLQQDDK
jgi:ParB family transcriptional regulator, chromosome partitioning protein